MAHLQRGVFPWGLHPGSRLVQEALVAVATSREDCTRETRKCADAIKQWEAELDHWKREHDRLRNLERRLNLYQEIMPTEEPIALTSPTHPTTDSD